jgi:hypothetical protein
VDGISEGGGGRDPQAEAEQVKRGGGGRRGAEGVGRVRVGGWFCIIIKVGEVGLITSSDNTWSLHKCVYFRCCFERYANKLFDSFEGPDKLCCSF